MIRLSLLLCCFQSMAFASNTPCDQWPTLMKPLCLRPYQTWVEGKNELYISGYAWHNRYYYDRARLHLHHYNENAYGGGIGKSFYDEDGDWHGLFALAFSDSHKNIEPNVGYAFLKMWHMTENAGAGLGYAILVTQRPDIFNGIPFLGALPWMSVHYHRASISATYIPGHHNVGNVLYVVGKWVL